MRQSRAKTPFEYTANHLALDFANTVNNRKGISEGPPEELLTDYSRLLQWSEESGALPKRIVAGLRPLAEADPDRAESALRRAVDLREDVYNIFLALTEHRSIPPASLAALNRAIQQAAAHAEIGNSDGGFSLEFIKPESSLDSMLWPIAKAAAELLTSEEIQNVRQCASDTCAWLFLDQTKNHRRRWCEMKTCGNRDKARRYYHRQKGS